MRASEFKKLIREEVRKVIAEAATVKWNEAEITKFFRYLNVLGLFLKKGTKLPTKGSVEITDSNMNVYRSTYRLNLDRTELSFDQTLADKQNSDLSTKGLVSKLKNDPNSKYKFDISNSGFIVSLKQTSPNVKTKTSVKSTIPSNLNDKEAIEYYVSSSPALENASPSKIKSVTKELFDEWKYSASNYSDVYEYLDELESTSGLENFL